MKLFSKPVALAMAGVVSLAACTDPAQLNQNPNLSKTQQGALIGAGAGALAGALSRGDGNRDRGAVIGAVVGGAIGAGIGYNLDQQEAELRRDLGNDDVQITNTGDRLIVSLPQDLLFATDSFSVRPDLQNDLYTVAGSLQNYPASTIQVIGHTDSDGDAAYNQRLSERRAGSVAGILMDAGVTPSRLQTIGRGESQPVASNLNEAGKAQNRRVEIIILPTA
ncbi:OmpA family protein [Roseobacter denitrificans]|uniref:OmpA family domain protein n=1 Tax=Roseobacter denitrificans (strain ATCC 33942 / OCh 114) TaxID=375451 RepID=Q16BK9_ROSDO|nr:OmpA family protein [Roseobacter denitrificans]ABG30634.1 OmpA family domain protein [Roseobacter denitrificans OCh 114]AVL53768.1 OmpA family protein [Roseobacter denitrificans]SFG19182.1 Outer membrane protein OmpA [Roseobacter denitrificans OCh 114]